MGAMPLQRETTAQRTIWFVAAFSTVIGEFEKLIKNLGDDPNAARTDEMSSLVDQLVVGSERFGFSDVAAAARAVLKRCQEDAAAAASTAAAGPSLGQDLRKLCSMMTSWSRAHHDAKLRSTGTLANAGEGDSRLLYVLANSSTATVALDQQLQAAGWSVILSKTRAELELRLAIRTPAAVLVDGSITNAVHMIETVKARLDSNIHKVYLSRTDDLDLQFLATHAGASLCLSIDLPEEELVERFNNLMGFFRHEAIRVLVICDREDRAQHYLTTLEDGGCEARWLMPSGSVVAEAVGLRPELLVVDLADPKLTGFDFGAVMRQHAAFSRLPFVYISAPPPADDKRLVGLATGTDDFLSPEVDELYLQRLVRARIVAARKLVMSSAVDPLTGLLGRDAFQRQFEVMVGMLSRSGGSLAVAAVEVDGLLEINREHGYAAGDRILSRVAAAFSRRFRSSDSLSRYVSGRFVMALPGADADSARRVVDEVRIRLQATTIKLDEGNLAFTTSAGIAGYRFKAGRGEVPLYAAQLVESAARALDRAREQGGGRSLMDSGR